MKVDRYGIVVSNCNCVGSVSLRGNEGDGGRNAWYCGTDSFYYSFDVHCCHTGTAIKHPVPDRVKPSFVIFWLWCSALSARVPGCQKITNDGLTRSGTGCFIAVPIRQQWATKG